MDEIVIYITFIPWLLYYFYNVFNALKIIKNKNVNISWVKNHLFQIFHFNDLMLYGIFFYFTGLYGDAEQIWLVSVLLFSVINLYLFINSFYDVYRSKNKLGVSDLSLILLVILTTAIPLIYYVSTKEYIWTYYILFIFGFCHYPIAILVKSLNNLLLNLLRINKK